MRAPLTALLLLISASALAQTQQQPPPRKRAKPPHMSEQEYQQYLRYEERQRQWREQQQPKPQPQQPSQQSQPQPAQASSPTPQPQGPRIGPKRFSFSPGLGVSMVSYTETNRESFTMTAVTAKAIARYVLSPNWDIHSAVFFTAYPIMKSNTATVRFLGVNLRAGYALSEPNSPWRFSLLAGLYYITMMNSERSFGFEHMSGPQIFPVLQRIFEKNKSLMFYLKYSPVAKKISLLAFSNCEMAGGTGYAWLLDNGHPFSISLDFAQLQLTIDEVKTATTSITAGVSYGF